jgi:outer membrane receptor protein involved in Fe transport
MPSRIPTIVGLLALSLSASSVAAQRQDTARIRTPPDTASAQQLPTVQVIGSVLHAAGPAVASGVPARVSILSRADLLPRRPRLLSDALAREPGVSLYDDLGSSSKLTLVTRGFTASPVVGLPQGVSVFLDGVPVNEPDAGQVNFDLLPLAHIERVEFLSGTASLLGPHSLGGAVNLMTRHGNDDPAGEIELARGSHSRYSANLSHGGRAPKGWSYYAGGGYASEEGWRQLTAATQLHGLLNVGRLGARRGARLQAFAANGNAETAGSLPLSVYRVKPDSNLSAGDFEDIDQLHVALSGYNAIGRGQVSGVAYFRSSNAERFNVNQVDDPDVRSFSDNRSIGASADWRSVFSPALGTIALRVGAGGSTHRTQVKILAERIDPGLTTHIESPIAKLDLYSVADVVRGPVTVSGGARYDLVRVPFRNRLDAARDTTSTFHRLSPRGGVSLALGSTGSVYASAGKSFRAPAVIELACADPNEPCPLPFALGDDPPLDPVVATTLEIGARWRLDALELAASAYRTSVRDDVFLFPYGDAEAPSNSTIDGFFANVDRTRREGIELSSRATIGPLDVLANYAWTRATFQVGGIEIFSIREEAGGENEVEKGDRLPLVPGHVASAALSLALPRGLTLGIEGRYTGERYLRGDEANDEEPLDGYLIADASIGFGFAAWDLQLMVRNLAASEHATFGTFNLNQAAGNALERFLTPGFPRTMHFAVRRQIGDLRPH